MPQKLNQYLKELEGFQERVLSMHNGLKTDSNTLQSFMDMEKEMMKAMMKEIKKMNKGKNNNKKEK
jgi:hypothetical protein